MMFTVKQPDGYDVVVISHKKKISSFHLRRVETMVLVGKKGKPTTSLLWQFFGFRPDEWISSYVICPIDGQTTNLQYHFMRLEIIMNKISQLRCRIVNVYNLVLMCDPRKRRQLLRVCHAVVNRNWKMHFLQKTCVNADR